MDELAVYQRETEVVIYKPLIAYSLVSYTTTHYVFYFHHICCFASSHPLYIYMYMCIQIDMSICGQLFQ